MTTMRFCLGMCIRLVWHRALTDRNPVVHDALTFYPRNWQTTTIEQFIQIVDSYIHWYNDKRIKMSLGSLSPSEYMESLGLAT